MDFEKIQKELENELNNIKVRANDEVTVLEDGTLVFNDDLETFRQLSEKQDKLSNLREFVSSNSAVLKEFNNLTKDAGVELSQVISVVNKTSESSHISHPAKKIYTKEEEIENDYLDNLKRLNDAMRNEENVKIESSEVQEEKIDIEAIKKAAYEQGLKDAELFAQTKANEEQKNEYIPSDLDNNKDNEDILTDNDAAKEIPEKSEPKKEEIFKPLLEETKIPDIDFSFSDEPIIAPPKVENSLLIEQAQVQEAPVQEPTQEDKYATIIENLVKKQYSGDANLTPEDIEALTYLKNEYKPVKPGEAELKDDLINWAYMNGLTSLKDTPQEPIDLIEQINDEPTIEPETITAPLVENIVEPANQKTGKKVVSKKVHTWKDSITRKLIFIKAIYTCENINNRTESYRDISLRIANFRLNHKNKSIESLNVELHAIDDLIKNSSELTVPEKKTLYKKLAKINRIAEKSVARNTVEETLTR